MRRQHVTAGTFIACLFWIAMAVVPAASGAAPRPVAILPLGDSITVGFGPAASTPGGYRGFLDASLNQAEYAHRLVGTGTANASAALTAQNQARHEGHNGYRVDQVTANLDGVAGAYDDRGGHWLTGTLTRPPIVPDVVLVHLGSNDLLKRFDPTNTYDDAEPLDEPAERALFVAALTQRLDDLIDEVQRLRPNARIVVSTVVPMDVGVSMDRALAAYAAQVRALVATRSADGSKVSLVDAYQAFLTDGRPTPGLLSQDNVHPTAAGYALLGRLFSEQVQAVS